MVLVNGSEGIGTGWSSSVPMYNPRDIVANLKAMMAGDEVAPMAPWYRGFTGQMQPADKGSYLSYGTVAKVDETTLHISELPLKKWTQGARAAAPPLQPRAACPSRPLASAAADADDRR